jgi:glycosyltransferase involved in cell wall biosynthesis
MNPEQKRITIGLPVYNGEKILAAAIESALQQSYRDFDLIISDNASTDGTPEICESFAERDSRVRYFRQSRNLGPVDNFNFVKGACETEFFVWLASDDRWSPDFLEKMLEIMDKNPDCSLAFCNFSVCDLKTGSREMVQISAADQQSPCKRILTRVLDMKPSLIYGLQRQSLIRDLEFELFDLSDVFFSLQAAARGTIRIVDARLYTAGTMGRRKPYSLTGKNICRTTFFRRGAKLFFANLSLPAATTLTLVLGYMLIRHFFVFTLRSLLSLD